MTQDHMTLFLARAGWADSTQTAIAQDASSRHYRRLHAKTGAKTAIFMIAPVDTAQDQRSFDAFIRLARHLRGLGLSAPDIFAADRDLGLMLIEDLGNHSFCALLRSDLDTAHRAYGAMQDVFHILAKAPLPGGIACLDISEQTAMTAPLFDFIGHGTDLQGALDRALSRALADHAAGPMVLALRDCHADNLLWLPHRDGAGCVGILDFQDGVGLPLGYDLASLVDDPRRAVPQDWRDGLIAGFAHIHHMTVPQAQTRINTLSLLRNLRIIAIFHRLSQIRQTNTYRAFLPRCFGLVARAAQDPALTDLREPVAEILRLTAPWADGQAIS
jgi:aminoglycoside/choline kinase family phosphotransferase